MKEPSASQPKRLRETIPVPTINTGNYHGKVIGTGVAAMCAPALRSRTLE
jgi:hypothetical protein